MDLSHKPVDPRDPITTPPSQGHRPPAEPVGDEMGLFGLGPDPRDDQLARHDLSSKPEDYFSGDPRHPHHEVL